MPPAHKTHGSSAQLLQTGTEQWLAMQTHPLVLHEEVTTDLALLSCIPVTSHLTCAVTLASLYSFPFSTQQPFDVLDVGKGLATAVERCEFFPLLQG